MFKIGERVSTTSDLGYGDGIVCEIRKGWIGVNHDIYFQDLHNCNRTCPMGHGYYYIEDQLKLLNNVLNNVLIIDINGDCSYER